jgi:acetyl-CoA acyltransferase
LSFFVCFAPFVVKAFRTQTMTKQMQDAYIVAATRTAVGKAPRGAFRSTRPDTLLAHVLSSVLAQVPALDAKRIEDVIVGCAMPEYEQGMNVARIGVLLAGLPNSVAGMTINRFCSSGLNAVSIAADRIRTGEADIMIAAGTESMSMIPMLGRLAINQAVFERGENVGIAYGMGLTAEKVAEQWKVTRAEQDAFALASHQKALAAQTAGDFDAEVSPITVVDDAPDLATDRIVSRSKTIARDEGPRADTSAEGLAKLRPVFAAKGSVTAGNSSQMSDGAGASILVSEKVLRELNLAPLARWLGYAVAGVPPEIMGVGPIAAIPKVLKSTGVSLADIDWIELNEAFAAQAIAVMRDLGLDPAKVNPLGGAIALGHPLGATGAIRTATILHGMRRRKQKYGMVSMCVGTGMGAAGMFEAL